MDTDLHLTGLEARIADSVGPTLTDMGYELVRVSVLGRDTPTVQIMADRADGSLIGVEDCEAISHAVGAVLDVDDPIPGAWNLEVSSAGIDRPLTREKDWNRFAGHLARAETLMPIDGRKRFAGTALGAENGVARLRVEDGTDVSLPLSEIRKARLVLTDALIAATAQMFGVPDEGAEGAAEAETPRAEMPRQADGRQKGAKVGGARVGAQKAARKPKAGPGPKPGRKVH
ncbi:ribosome maturation factor RimP [Acetobacteraceae bacterium KSS8]|uniref:Ribosome maturation factor RimP n=1 Tax=Endosaccharibacter trunci TaxID=2812733 RepID=A0ABT1W5P5_9PROT|nr:ribosome maturation factor RimP [Acetobacteraceae bacterium KSS8]